MLKSWYEDRFIKHANTNNTYKMSKYISKYILKGGGSYEDLLVKLHIDHPHTRTYCADTSFSNHTGECWHDSLAMIFCYTDGIKEMVQKKLLNLRPIEIIDLAVQNRLQYLAPCFRHLEFFLRLEKYLTLLQNRFCAHTRIISEEGVLVHTRMCARRSSKEPHGEYYSRHDHPVNVMRRRHSFVAGVHGAKIAQTLIHDDPHIEYESDDDTDKYRDSFFTGHDDMCKIFGQSVKLATGENPYASQIWCHVLSFCLLDGDTSLILKNIMRAEIDDTNKDELLESMAILINSENHVMAIYKCNDRDIFYNDNYNNQITDEYKHDKDEEHTGPKTTEKASKLFVNRPMIFNLLKIYPDLNFYNSRAEHTHPILHNHITKETYRTHFEHSEPPVYNDNKFTKVHMFTTISGKNIPVPNENEYMIYIFALSHVSTKVGFDDIKLDLLTRKYATDIITNIIITKMSYDAKTLLFNQFIQKNKKIDTSQMWHGIIKKNDMLIVDIVLSSDLQPYRVFTGLYLYNAQINKILSDDSQDAKILSQCYTHDNISVQFLKKMYVDGYMVKVIAEIGTHLQKESSFIEKYGDFLCRAIYELYMESVDYFPILQASIKLCRDYLAGSNCVKQLVSILMPEHDDATSDKIRA